MGDVSYFCFLHLPFSDLKLPIGLMSIFLYWVDGSRCNTPSYFDTWCLWGDFITRRMFILIFISLRTIGVDASERDRDGVSNAGRLATGGLRVSPLLR